MGKSLTCDLSPLTDPCLEDLLSEEEDLEEDRRDGEEYPEEEEEDEFEDLFSKRLVMSLLSPGAETFRTTGLSPSGPPVSGILSRFFLGKLLWTRLRPSAAGRGLRRRKYLLHRYTCCTLRLPAFAVILFSRGREGGRGWKNSWILRKRKRGKRCVALPPHDVKWDLLPGVEAALPIYVHLCIRREGVRATIDIIYIVQLNERLRQLKRAEHL